MAVIGAATATDDGEPGQHRLELAVLSTELDRIAGVDLRLGSQVLSNLGAEVIKIESPVARS